MQLLAENDTEFFYKILSEELSLIYISEHLLSARLHFTHLHAHNYGCEHTHKAYAMCKYTLKKLHCRIFVLESVTENLKFPRRQDSRIQENVHQQTKTILIPTYADVCVCVPFKCMWS